MVRPNIINREEIKRQITEHEEKKVFPTTMTKDELI